MRRALITGIAGFAGSHLAEQLIAAGWEVSGVERPGAPVENLRAVTHLLTLRRCDILEASQITAVIEGLAPDVIFHLAAVTFVPSAEDAPQATFDANVKGTLNLFEACRKCAPGARVILASSAEVYGKVPPGEMPLAETRPPAPANLYALTKRCAEEIAVYYHRVHSIPAVVLRPFNHIGPRQNASFVTASFASQIAQIEAGRRKPVIEVGNLEAARDFTDVRDVVRAYRLAAEKCEPGEIYNVGSGRAYIIAEMLERLLKLSRVAIDVQRDPARLRKSEIPLLVGDCRKFRRAAGWEPAHDIDATLVAILDYWRSLQ